MYKVSNFECKDGLYYVGNVLDADCDPWVSIEELETIIEDLNNDVLLAQSNIYPDNTGEQRYWTMCITELEFEESLKVLQGNWGRLTKEEEDTINKISSRFK